MKLFKIGHRISLLLALVIGVQISIHSKIVNANQDVTYYSDLKSFAEEPQVLGTVVQIGANWCWSTSRPSGQEARKRLQIFVRDKWRSVGKVSFKKTDRCTKKNPFEQIFSWEIDRLGSVDEKNPYYGTLRLRATTFRPSMYATVNVYESQEAIQRALDEQVAEYGRVFECVLLGGQWDASRNICVKS